MTDPNRIPLLEAQLERTALERDEARQVLAELGKENARLRASNALYREALADHRREIARLREDRPRCSCGGPLGHESTPACHPALSEEEGTPAGLPGGFPYTVPGEEYVRGWRDGVQAAADFVSTSAQDWRDEGEPGTADVLDSEAATMLYELLTDAPGTAPSPATPSDGRCPKCWGAGTEGGPFTRACHACGGSGRAAPRGDR